MYHNEELEPEYTHFDQVACYFPGVCVCVCVRWELKDSRKSRFYILLGSLGMWANDKSNLTYTSMVL